MTDELTPQSAEDRNKLIGALTTFLLVLTLVNAEINVLIATEASFLRRIVWSGSFVLIALGISWAAGALWNLFSRPWRAPRIETLCVAVALLVGLSIYGSWPDGKMPSLWAISQARQPLAEPQSAPTPPPGLKPYHGEVVPMDEGQCPPGKRRSFGHCIDPPKAYVERNFTGNCPAGYVDHPHTPALCALPAEAERLLKRARGG
jgi:hypothetical protein